MLFLGQINADLNPETLGDLLESAPSTEVNETIQKAETCFPSCAQVAIEVLGPHKTVRNTNAPMASAVYRRRLLEAWGWRVLTVPYDQWSACGRGSDSKELLLQALLGVALPDVYGSLIHV